MPYKLPLAAVAIVTGLWGCTTTTAPHNLVPSVQTIKVDDTTLSYVEQGQGETIVFVHGGGGDWRTWEPLRPYISSKYRFVSYSRRYHFPTDDQPLTRPYTVPAQADDLIALVSALGVGPVHVVGGSYGGRVAIEAALKRPDLFRSVAASEPFITPPTTPEAGKAAQALAADLGKIGEAMAQRDTKLATVHLANAVFGDPLAWGKLPPPTQARFLDNQKSWIALAAAPQAAPPNCDALGKLAVPALVLEGEATVAGFRVTNDRLMQCLPKGTQRAVVPGAPHMWYPANPQGGAQSILKFVQSVPKMH